MLELDGIWEVIFRIIQLAGDRIEPSYFNSASLDAQCLRLDQTECGAPDSQSKTFSTNCSVCHWDEWNHRELGFQRFIIGFHESGWKAWLQQFF